MKQVKAETELPVVPQHPPQVGELLLGSVHKGGSFFGQVTETGPYRQISWWEKFCAVKSGDHAWLREGKDSSLPFSPRPLAWNDPHRINGKLVRYRIVVVRFHTEDDLTAKNIQVRYLYLFRVTTDAEAQRVFDGGCQIVDQLEASKNTLAADAVTFHNTQVEEAVTKTKHGEKKPTIILDAERKFWQRRFPNTHKALNFLAKVSAGTDTKLLKEQARQWFEIESAKLSGKLPRPVDNVAEIKRLAEKLKGKTPKDDGVDEALLDGFKNKNFARETPEAIADAIEKTTGKRLKVPAIRQRCNRLELRTELQPGPRRDS